MIARREVLLAALGALAGCARASSGGSAEPAVTASPPATASPTATATTTATATAGASPAASPAASPTAATTVTASASPTPESLRALRAKLKGTLFLPGDDGYATAHRVYNPRWDTRRPAGVARCRDAADVQACVEAAREAGIPIAARSGGHSYGGYCAPDGGLQVDLSSMSAVSVSGASARIGSGAKLADVYAALAKAGRALPAGSCPTVGVAGLTLGGGIGVLTRKFGLTCDRLSELSLVTADSRVVTASGDDELFWALRGAGGGNLGIVTQFVFDTVPAPHLVVFSLRFEAGAGPDVLGAWQEWIAAAPPELWSNLVLTAGSPPTCRVGGCFVGTVAGLTAELAKLKVSAATRKVLPKSYGEAMRYFAGPAERQTFVASNRLLARPVADPADLVTLLDGRRGIVLLVDSLGGAVSDVAPDATAFPHRKALASVQIYKGTTPASAPAAAVQVAEVRDGLTTLVGERAYVNYIDPGMHDWPAACYGDNLPRLREIVHRHDPDWVFRFAQGISPA